MYMESTCDTTKREYGRPIIQPERKSSPSRALLRELKNTVRIILTGDVRLEDMELR